MHRARRAAGFLSTAAIVLAAAAQVETGAQADPLPRSADHIATPGGSVAADDTGDAIVLNPANLAWLPASELRWTWVRCPNDAEKVG